jgi:hypothetical protein
MKRNSITQAVMAFSVFTAVSSQGAIVLTGNTVYTQNFNTLITTGNATFTDNSTIAGLYAQRTGTGTSIAADAGSGTAGNLYSYGTGTTADRAIGSLGSGNAAAGSFAWGFVFQNNTAQTLVLSEIGYTGEQWRNSAAAAQTITFSYTVAVAAITNLTPGEDTSWTSLSALDFTSPITGGTAGSLDGNATANRTVLSNSPNISIPAGHFITLRWRDPDHAGTDHGLAIDDVSVTFIPEPSAALLGGLGLLALLRRRR